MFELEESSGLAITVAVGVAVIFAVVFVLALLCGLMGLLFMGVSEEVGFIGQAILPIL